jgi:hypothetical protein
MVPRGSAMTKMMVRECFHVRDIRWADYELVAIWTAVPYDTAISAYPQHLQPMPNNEGWVECLTDSGPSRIWLPAERRISDIKAVAASKSRLVIGGGSESMTMIALAQ